MKPELVITVDNGITAVREVQRLNDEGIKTIITDHHLADPGLLPSGIVVNPNHPECNYSFKKISGCAVALKMVMALRKSLRKKGWWTSARPEPNLRKSLDLADEYTYNEICVRPELRNLTKGWIKYWDKFEHSFNSYKGWFF